MCHQHGIQTELTGAVVAPAADAASRSDQCAHMRRAGGNRGHSRTQALNVHRDAAVDDCVVTELTVGVVTPALDTTARGERAIERVAARDHGDICGEADDIDRNMVFNDRVVPELAAAITAPAFDATCGG